MFILTRNIAEVSIHKILSYFGLSFANDFTISSTMSPDNDGILQRKNFKLIQREKLLKLKSIHSVLNFSKVLVTFKTAQGRN